MNTSNNDSLKQLDNLLSASNQSWLFGAGISFNAGIPLMGPLTSHVFSKAEKENDELTKEVLQAIKDELPEFYHIEHILSQLGDYSTIAERSKDKKVKIGSRSIGTEELGKLHSKLLRWIAEIIRWGYIPGNEDSPEKIGSRDEPLVKVDWHRDFMLAMFNRSQAGISERRGPVRLFTTNYDTLIEDALSLCCIPYWDGFLGGAVAFRSHHYGEKEPDFGYRAHVIKLHGSIDWHLGDDDRVWRVRDGDLYPNKSAKVIIYPQATKYLATQRDPFSAQFDLFRRTLGLSSENVLATCGYSYGDEHINQEIELSMQHSDNKTTILAFSSSLNPVLERWRASSWAKRLYVISENGVYVGSEGPYFPPTDGTKMDWWTFSGVTKILSSGAEAFIK
jgi:hypothetical protein